MFHRRLGLLPFAEACVVFPLTCTAQLGSAAILAGNELSHFLSKF
jgi:hypothetical protein